MKSHGELLEVHHNPMDRNLEQDKTPKTPFGLFLLARHTGQCFLVVWCMLQMPTGDFSNHPKSTIVPFPINKVLFGRIGTDYVRPKKWTVQHYSLRFVLVDYAPHSFWYIVHVQVNILPFLCYVFV